MILKQDTMASLTITVFIMAMATFDTIRVRPLDPACEDAEDASESEAEGDFYFLFFIVLLLLPPVIV
jgi:hypothetical protein